MYSLTAVGIVVLLATGAWLVWFGWRDRRDPHRPTHARRARISRAAQIRLLAGLGGGIVAWIVTGWFLLVPILTVGALFVPTLMGRRAADDQIARLTALEEWLRSLVGMLTAGQGLEQALINTRKTAPRELETEIGTLTARLATGADTHEALVEFADALDDATGDLVCSATMIAARLRNSGLPKALSDFADTVAEDVRDRRAVEVDRRGPRTQARLVTIIVIAFLVYLFTMTDYMTPYQSPGMQIVLAGLLAGFAALLLYMRYLTRPINPPRFLREPRDQQKWWSPATVAEPSPRPAAAKR